MEPPPRNPRSGPPLRGAKCLTELFVPLEAAIHGGDVEVSYEVQGVCGQCHGHARGRCPVCFGKGVVSYRKCETIKVEPGAWDGQRIVVEGAGHPGTNGGAAGDAIFTIVVVCSSAFRRDGLSIACDIEVDFVTAMLGGSHEVDVLGRALPIAIEPNSGAGFFPALKDVTPYLSGLAPTAMFGTVDSSAVISQAAGAVNPAWQEGPDYSAMYDKMQSLWPQVIGGKLRAADMLGQLQQFVLSDLKSKGVNAVAG